MEAKGVVILGIMLNCCDNKGIPYRFGENDLYDLFSDCGAIQYCNV